ncbi:uncharacterized protein L201_006534 [Kwoniella dendrophila CBS 6074]|uniref:Aftiphilin clathrin-binding box domain-containing protein n=1 Tax=Kwoniella dendrophila CBS 6074 TaxID=1295534 RepID=A0AAX4K4B0_9TREE
MDDPWAGPSWSTPSKPSSSITMTMPSPGRSTPPPRFDDSDPWGTTHPPQSTTEQGIPHTPEPQEAGKDVAETSGWGGEEHAGWGQDKVDESETPNLHLEDGVEVPETVQAKEDLSYWNDVKSSSEEISSERNLPQDTEPTSPPQHISPIAPLVSPPVKSSPIFAEPIPTFAGENFPSSSVIQSPIPNSPSFGDDFGGFSAGPSFSTSAGGDPWGNNAVAGPSGNTAKIESSGWGDENVSWNGGKNSNNDDSWGGDMSFGEEGGTSFKSDPLPKFEQLEITDNNDQEEEEDGEGWGRSRDSVPIIQDKSKEEDDWEEAQRRIQIKQERAPQEKIDELTKAWTDLLGSVITMDLEKLTGAEELQYEEKVKKLEEDTIDKLRSLSTIPSNINTYPPVITSLITHERFAYALQRPNPAPSTSLLNTTTSRRPARADPLILNSSSSETSWTSRSMLGEPDAPLQEGASQVLEEQNRSRWSFWGRRPVPERQLTTSGGGVLERKSFSTSSPDPNNERNSTDAKSSPKPSSRTPSISIGNSRPSSPAPPAITESTHPTPANSTSQPSTQPQPPAQAQPVQAAPSAVSRFFGRLSRNKSSTSTLSQEADDENGKDLELSADDFSFLSEVPSMSQQAPENGVGDLLALEPGRNEQIASLESLLNSKAAPLPKPLAPPPKSSSIPSGSQNRSSSGRFVARMKSPPPTDMDLLGDLNFDGSAHNQNPSSTVQSPVQTISSPTNAWDDFLSLESGPSKTIRSSVPTGTKASSTPMIAPPLVPSRSSTPTVSLSPPPPASQNGIPPISMIAPKATPATPANKVTSSDDFGDFDDFGTPQHASTSTFDDFGDFSAFDSTFPAAVPETISTSNNKPLPIAFGISIPGHTQTPGKSVAPTTIFTPNHQPKNSLSTPINQVKPGSLDHTPTINLLSGASASKGKRWPAPPSPVAPVLPPPPKSNTINSSGNGNNGGGGFPFLSPPPPGRPNSRSSNLLDESNTENNMETLSSPLQTKSAAVSVGMGIAGLGNNQSSGSIFGGSLQPSRSSTPIQTISQKPTTHISSPQQTNQIQGKGGLSASDLSFFDSL